MQERTWTNLDRSGWPKGPWDGEPDKVQFVDQATGLPCLAVRNQRHGNWCGYVGVAPGHPMHGIQYQNVGVDIENVHGGLTFSDSRRPSEDEGRGICHIADPGEPDHVWWFGFDCAHAWDISPGLAHYFANFPDEGEYRDLEYVKSNCRQLAAQLLAAVV